MRTTVFATKRDVIEREIAPTLIDAGPVTEGQIDAIFEGCYRYRELVQGFVCVVGVPQYWVIVESVLSDPGELPAP